MAVNWDDFKPLDGAAPSSAGPVNWDDFKPAPNKDGALTRGINRAKSSAAITTNLATGNYADAARNIAESDAYQRANPGTPEGNELSQAWQRGDGITGGIKEVAGELAKDWNEAPGLIGKLRATGKNLSAMGGGIVEQMPNMVAPMGGMLAGGAAGSLAGPVGTAAGAWAGASAGNALMEGQDQVTRALQNAGINPQDRSAVERHLAQNGDTVLGQAALKGGIIGAVDTATMGLGSKLLTAPAKAAADRALADLGIDVADTAAVKAAMKTPEIAKQVGARMATDAEYLAATSGTRGLARHAAVAALEPAGEFTGEYLGQGAATGDFDAKDAFLEAVSSLGQSGATFAGQKAYQVITNPARGVQPKADPNAGPLSRAAATADASGASAPVAPVQAAPQEADPFADVLGRLTQTDLRAIRGAEGYGPESVNEVLRAASLVRNPEADPLLRQQAADALRSFWQSFDNRPNWTTPKPQAEQPGTAVAPVEQSQAVAEPSRPFFDPNTLEGDATEIAGTLPGAPRQLTGPEKRFLEAPDRMQAKRDADAAYEQAYQDLVKAEQLGASDRELLAYQQALTERKALRDQLNAQLADTDARVRGTTDRETTISRRSLLDTVLNDPETKNPLPRFESMLKRQGFSQRRATDDERQAIERFQSARDTFADMDREQVAPNELDAAAMGIRERQPKVRQAPPKPTRAAFPMSREGAERQAVKRTQATGQRFEAVPHPTVAGRFAVQPVASAPIIESGINDDNSAAPVEMSSADPRREPASWVIRNKATGEPVLETFDRKKVDALNTEKYEAVPIQEHLASLNRQPTNTLLNSGEISSDEQRYQSIKQTPPVQRSAEDVAWANEYRAKQSAPSQMEAAEQAEQQRAKQNDTDGFAESVSAGNAMRQAKVRSALNQIARFNGTEQPRKEAVRSRVASGATVEEREGQDALVNPDGSYLLQSHLTKTGIDYAKHLIAAKQQGTANEKAAKAFTSEAQRGTAQQAETVAVDVEKLREKKQTIEDMIATKKEMRETVPQGWINKLAEVNAQLRGEQTSEGEIYSSEVEGHPMFDGSPMLRNLIPIKVKNTAEAERKLFSAQELYSKMAGDRAKAEHAQRIAKTAAEKRKAADALKALDNQGATAETIETLRNVTLPELQRLAKEAEAKFGPAQEVTSAPEPTQTLPQAGQASRPQGAQEGAQEPGQGVEALRTQLQNVERDILAAAPPKFSVGGGDIEGAMRSLKVPRALKEQRKAIKEQMRVAQQPRSELDTVAERIPATHADAGQTPEQATAPVIREAIQKSARNTAFNAREAKAWLLGEIDKAIADVPPANRDMAADLAQERARTFKPSDRVAKLGKGTMRDKLEREERENFEAMKADRIAKTARMIGFVTFDVPGDGRFKVVNTPEALQAFADKVKSSPGFRDNPTVKPSFGTGNAQGSSLDESLKRLGNTPEALQEIGNAIEIARLRKAKDEDKLLDRFREASGGKEYDAWRAEQDAEGEIVAREAGQSATPNSPEPRAEQGQQADTEADTQAAPTGSAKLEGSRRDPTKVSAFMPYEDGDIVRLSDGKEWQVRQDMGGWYLTSTGNWRGTHPTIQKVRAMNDMIREVEQAAQSQDIQRSFAGESARTADTHALASARSRIAAGEDAETVRQETGWHRGADSQWRFEINDADARLKSGEDTSTNPAAFIDWIDEAQGRADGIPLSQAFDHPALFAAYPQLQAVRLRVDPDMKAGNAKYSPKQGSFGTITITDPFNLTPEQYAKLPSIVLHEVQHAIQSVEGFAVGGSPEQMAKERTRAKDLRDRFTMARALGLAAEQNFDGNVDAAAQWFREAGFDADPAVDVLMTEGLPRVQRLAERYEARAKELGIDSRGGQDGRDLYKRLAGEVEARNTQTRQKMSDAERRAVSPGFTADVADADVIVTFNGREMANAPAPANAEPTGTTQAAILAAIRDLVGPLRTNRITVVQSADELVTQGVLSSKDADGTQAFVKDGKAYFIAGNIRPGNERAVFLHEVGSHLGMEKILSPFARKVLLTKIRNFAQQSGTLESRIAKAAQRRVEAAGATGTDAESELLAYFVEEAVKAGVNPAADAQSAIGQWFRQFMAGIRAALEKLGLLSPKALTAQDVVDMARGAAQVAMEQEGTSVTPESAQEVTDKLRKMGHDGVILDYASTAKRGKPVENEIVVFDSSQVKSAIGNSGAFDPADARIQFSKAASAIGATWDVPESSKLFNRFDADSLLYTLQDKHIDTRRVVEAIRKQSGDIADEFNPYLQEELFHGRSAKGVKDFLDSELRPLLAEMTLRKVSMADLEEFLHARHAEERNIQIAKINPKMPDGGSGMETQTARDYLAALDPAKKATYDALARKIDAINAATRDVLVQSGLEKPETVKAWEGAYKHYVPLQREEVESDGLRIGQGFSVKGSASKRAMGSDKNVVDIIANIAMQRERAIVRAEKNRVAQALYGLSLKAPNPDFWITVNPADAKAYTPKQQQTVIDELVSMGLDPADAQSFVKEPTQRYVDPRTGLVSERINPVMRSAPNVLSVRVNGEDRYVFFNESDARASRMVHALKNLDADQLGRLLQTSAKITRWFASVNTQFNPVFGAINILRDVQSAMLNLSTTPLRGKEGKVLADTFSALRGIYSDLRAIRKGGTASSQWASLWEEFQKEGGQTGYRDMFSNSTERAEAIQKELDQIGEGKLKTRGRAMFNWLSDYNEAMENAVRLAAYKEAKDKGLSNQQAASLAKNLTVNFNRKGQIAAQAGALYAFFNASAQGSYRMIQTLKGPAGRKIILGGLTLGAMQAVMLMAAGFDDDEPPQFVRERSIIVPDFVAGSGKYLSIPMPIGFHVIPNISRILTEWALGGFQHTGDRISSLLGLFADTFNPIGNAGVSMQTIAPTAMDPFAALAENKDWTGKPIAREDMSALDPSPGFTRAKDTASWISKTIAYYANLATGGTDYKPGMVSPSPDQIDYLLGQLTGGVGREYMKAEQTVTSIVTGEDLPAHKIPLLGRFYGDTTGQASEANRFYANLREVNMHKSEIEGRRKAGEDVMGYLQDNPTARLSVGASRFETQLRKLKQARRAAMNADAEPERIQQIDAQITTVMHSFNARFAQLEAQ